MKKLISKEHSSVENSSMMSESRDNLKVTDIYKVVREYWNDETVLAMSSMQVTVPSNLLIDKNLGLNEEDAEESTLNIETGMHLVMKYKMLTKTKYDIQNELYPINIAAEVQDSDYEQIINFTKLRLYMTGINIQEKFNENFDSRQSQSNNTMRSRRITTKKKTKSSRSSNPRGVPLSKAQTYMFGVERNDEQQNKDLLNEVSFDFRMVWKTLENSAITD